MKPNMPIRRIPFGFWGLIEAEVAPPINMGITQKALVRHQKHGRLKRKILRYPNIEGAQRHPAWTCDDA